MSISISISVYVIISDLISTTNRYLLSTIHHQGGDVTQTIAYDPMSLNGHKGTAGHVSLKYRSGGVLTVSAGHWVELGNLQGASDDKVMGLVSKQFGAKHAACMQAELSSATSAPAREEVIQVCCGINCNAVTL